MSAVDTVVDANCSERTHIKYNMVTVMSLPGTYRIVLLFFVTPTRVRTVGGYNRPIMKYMRLLRLSSSLTSMVVSSTQNDNRVKKDTNSGIRTHDWQPVQEWQVLNELSKYETSQ
jgi:hypothetical protein